MARRSIAAVVNEAIGAARAHPERAAEILLGQADSFLQAAYHPKNVHMAPTLIALAGELAAQAQPPPEQQPQPAFIDDFEELVSDHLQAVQEVGGGGDLGDLPVLARRRAIREGRRNTRVQRVSSLPASVNDATRLAQEGYFKYGPTAADVANGIKVSDTVILWQGTKTEAQSFTIDIDVNTFTTIGPSPLTTVVAASNGAFIPQFPTALNSLFVVNTEGFAPSGTLTLTRNGVIISSGITYTGLTPGAFTGLLNPAGPNITVQTGDVITQLAQPVSSRPYALVEMGADAYRKQFIIDVGVGTRLTGHGNYCSVILGMDPPAPGFLSSICFMGGRLGFGSAHSQVPPTRTAYIDALAAGATTAIAAVPFRGRFILPVQESDANGSWQLIFYDSTSTAVTRTPVAAAGSQVGPIPVTGDITQYALLNAGANVANFRIPFEIAD